MFALIRMHSALILWMFVLTIFSGTINVCAGPRPLPVNRFSGSAKDKYHRWQLASAGLSEKVFMSALKGHQRLLQRGMLTNPDIITIIDFTKPSTEKRLYVIDIRTGTLLFNTLVAHGRNSGREYARRFSNAPSSFASSPGFYVTADTYEGKHGYSLRLQGCERGWNDRAKQRAIVVHGADYVSETFIQQHGFLGRSHGCPALPEELSAAIIDEIRNGSCLFIYAPAGRYLQRSALLN